MSNIDNLRDCISKIIICLIFYCASVRICTIINLCNCFYKIIICLIFHCAILCFCTINDRVWLPSIKFLNKINNLSPTFGTETAYRVQVNYYEEKYPIFTLDNVGKKNKLSSADIELYMRNVICIVRFQSSS